MVDNTLSSLIERLPKAELHCHLEGSIQPATLLELAERNGVELPFHDEEGAEEFYEFESLNDFLEIFALACSTLRTAEDFRTITLDLAADADRQNIPYREVFFTYPYHDRRGVPWRAVVDGIAEGRRQAREKYGVEMKFIADIDRTIDPEEGVELVERAHEVREQVPIIGIGLDSQEIDYPAHRQKPAYDRARELGFHRVGHAGEDVGPKSVWDALESLGLERVDHGVRSIEDEELVDHLADNGIPLTVCPVSNVALKVYSDIAAHPVQDLIRAGVVVTINSDDPPMFHTDVNHNFKRITHTFDLSADDLIGLARNSFEASFLGEPRKQTYLKRFEEAVAELRQDLGLD